MRKEQRRNIKYLKREEWEKLRRSIDKSRDRIIIELLYQTGLRVGELVKAQVEDIDFGSGFLAVPWQNTKTKTGRAVFIEEETLNKLKGYLRDVKRKQGTLFDISKRRIQEIIQHYSKKSGVKASAHTLRHSHIVHALMDKVPITAVQKQVGHKRLETTQIYSDLAPEQVKEAYLTRERRERNNGKA